MPKSKIAWCDATMQVVAGCDIASPGCRNCYSCRLCATRQRHLRWAKGLAEPVVRQSVQTAIGVNSARIRKVETTTGYQWTGKVTLRPDQISLPIKGGSKVIFVGDRGDIFRQSASISRSSFFR